jgi:hypothetical protein
MSKTRWAVVVAAVCLVVTVAAVAYAAGKVKGGIVPGNMQNISWAQSDMEIAAVVTSVVALLVSIIFGVISSGSARRSAAASEKSAGTAWDALGEMKRQGQLTITPSVTANARKLTRSTQDRTPLEIVNAGRGLARNVAYRLDVIVKKYEGGEECQPQKDMIAQLAAGTCCEITGYRADAHPRLDKGLIRYEDIEGGRYWSRYDADAKTWQVRPGDPPEQPQDDGIEGQRGT